MKNKLLLVLLLCSFSAFAQSDPQKILDEFFNLYKSKGVDASLDYIFGTNKWMDNSKDQIDEVKQKLSGTLKLLGDYQGHNLITRKSLGEHLTLFSYMMRYDRQPLRFSILLYKPNDQWKLLHFSYDDHLSEELGEAVKLHRLDEN